MKSTIIHCHNICSFELVINDIPYQCHKPVIYFLSAVVRNFIDENPNSQSYFIRIEDANKYHVLISQILAFKTVIFSKDSYKFIQQFSKLLGITFFQDSLPTLNHYYINGYKNCSIMKNLMGLEKLYRSVTFENMKDSQNLMSNLLNILSAQTIAHSFISACMTLPYKIELFLEMIIGQDSFTLSKAIDRLAKKIIQGNEWHKNEMNLLLKLLAESQNKKYHTVQISHRDTNSEENEPNYFYIEIIRKDNVEELQKYVISKTNNDQQKDQWVIIPSDCERCSLLYNHNWSYNHMKIIDYAAFCGSSKCFRQLVINNFYFTKNTIKYAIAGGNVEIIRLCEQYERDEQLFQTSNYIINFSNTLEYAMMFNHHNIVEWLIDFKGQEKDAMNHYDTIIKYFNIKTLLFYLKRGHNPNNFIIPAAKYGCIELLEALKQLGCMNYNVNDQLTKMNPLHFAIKNQNYECIKYLLKEPSINVNSQTFPHLKTPLHMAVENNDEISVCLLLKEAEVNQELKNNEYKTPLQVAKDKKMVEIINIFLSTAKEHPLKFNR
ncbi:hypothetical protein TRFO_12007 [Tritrichomonas foetus]|uniref:Uncharacterized protein n=1 Tax=Tritrichomonas foetus TaxID=1144522 RepID=A0A1J4J6X8_9EUKA|nr:hypothetical protein TRFO_12007 [Tritrichomonas foetus]|eukprot:OHS93189.1 hypothetical protein TRFO_12007 [Tritrichomonas foetus]